MAQRNKKFGFGQWQLPGGHMEFQESFEESIRRECMEELAIDVKVGKLVSVAPNKEFGFHYIVFTFEAESYIGEPVCQSPDEHSVIKWFSQDSLPEELFVSAKNAFENILSGRIYIPEAG